MGDQKTKRPNFIVVVLDDLGAGQFGPLANTLQLEDLDPGLMKYALAAQTPYSPSSALDASQRATPFLEKLSEQGVLFTRAYAASSLCAPSRQAILTGSNPARWGAYRNIDVNVCGLPAASSLVTALQGAGYRTGLVGKWHVGSRDHAIREKILSDGGTDEDISEAGYWGSATEEHHPLNHGFDYAFFYNLWECPFYNARTIWENRDYTGTQSEYNTDLFTKKALSFMEDSCERGEPFFLELAYHAVHIPLDVDPPEEYRRHVQTGDPIVDRFYSHVYAVDRSIQRIVERLQENGEWDNTVLFFTSDNGATCKMGKGDLSLVPGNANHRGHKGQYLLGGVRVPLLFVAPGLNTGKNRVDRVVSLMDILPTSLALAGLEIPSNIDGRSLLPLLHDSEAPHHDTLFHVGIHAPSWGYTAQEIIGDSEKRRDLFPGAWTVLSDQYILRFVGELKPGLLRRCPDGQRAFYEMYQHQEDPLEAHNLYATHPEIAEALLAEYEAFAAALPPPHQWSKKRWAELMPSTNPNRSDDWTHLPEPKSN